MRLLLFCLWGMVIGSLYGCSTAGYYAQSVQGQMEIWRESRPISGVLSDPDVPDKVKQRLELALEIRRFAVKQMHLPDNKSYTEYVDLKRPFAVWSVFVAPELSLQPEEWCFFVVGCVNYRGYFEKHSAHKFAQKHSAQGYDVYIGGVPAYSTLGWFDDPVPNTILSYSEEDFAGLIFHELAHQVAFAKGDTVFNESFANMVEQVGVERWLTHSGDSKRIADYHLRRQRDQEIIAIILEHRARLQRVYDGDLLDAEKRQAKQQVIAELKETYFKKLENWPSYIGYKYWFEQPINNAKLVSIATYHDLIPAFEKLLQEQQADLKSFYEIVKKLAAETKSSRWQTLSAL